MESAHSENWFSPEGCGNGEDLGSQEFWRRDAELKRRGRLQEIERKLTETVGITAAELAEILQPYLDTAPGADREIERGDEDISFGGML